MNWLEFIMSILAGLAAAIPLIIKLVEYVKKSVREKNWGSVLELVMNYMAVAEEKFTTGAERKEWVLDMIKKSSEIVNYDIDYDVLDKMIDNLCNLTKVVNAPSSRAVNPKLSVN